MAYNIKGDLGVLRRIFSRFIRVESLSGNTGNVLAADNNGEIVSRNVDFFLTGSTIFNNKVNNSTFYPYTSATNTLIGTKLDKSAFTGFTDSFYAYTSTTNTLIGTKLDTSIFANYTANTGSNVSAEFTAFTQTFYQYTADTNNLINTKLDKTTFTAFTNSFNSYSANTLNTINTKLDTSVFTSFTNSFYSYSSNTLNTINNNYSQFTGFTNTFNSYSANTLTSINNKVIELGPGVGSTIRINNNNTVLGNYSTISGGVNNTILSGCNSVIGGGVNNTTSGGNVVISGGLRNSSFNAGSFIGGGYCNTSLGVYSVIGGGFRNTILDVSSSGILGGQCNLLTAPDSFIIGSNITGTTTNTTYVESINIKNNIYDSLGSTGLSNYILTTTPTGVKWLSGTTSVDISGKLDTSVFTSFTDSFYSYSSNTQNTINNNYNQFTGFTNDFNSYSSNTQTQLNNKYDKSGGTISGSVTILGDLIVNGTATTINTQNLLVYDPIIGLALVQSGSTNPTLDSGFIIERGLSGNTGFIWKEVNKQFELGYTNNTYNDINVNISQFGDLKVGGLKTNYIYDSLSSTGLTNYILTTTPTGIKWLSGTTTVDISGKLDTSVFTAFTNSFYSYSSNTQNTINNNYSQFTAFTNSFNSYSANTRNTINNNYSQFTSFTNSFYSYSSNTQNTINSNYRQFTAFTNTFYVYSAQTDSRLLFSSGTVGSTFRVNNNNEASGQYSTVSGGQNNNASGNNSFIGGGSNNSAAGNTSSIAGGSNNILLGTNSLIGGGRNNYNGGDNSLIGGGTYNTSSGNCSFIGGGGYNTSLYDNTTIGGGYSNFIESCDGSIGGGMGNFIINGSSTIGGGVMNAIGQVSTFSGYWNNSFFAIPNDVSTCFNCGDDLRIFDSLRNKVCCSTVSNSYYNPGTTCTEISLNTPIDTMGTFPLYNKTTASSVGEGNFIGGGRANVASGAKSVVAGGNRNTVNGNHSTISGGYLNTASGIYSFIGGGYLNTASGSYSFVGGGNINNASGNYSTVSGGIGNKALGNCSFVGGGIYNTASGSYSFVGGGIYNTSSGNNTFILGSNITGTLDNTTYVENLNVRNNIYDSFGTTGTTGYLLSTTPTGVKWVSGATSTSLTPNFDYIDFTTGYTTTAKTARVYYDSNEQALSYFPNTPGMDVTVNIGQESLIRVYNNTGVQINNGSVVHISGSSLGLPTIVLSNAAFDGIAEVAGVATHDIPNNTIGFITNFGIVRDVNTSAFNVGDELYLSDTISGGFTNNVIGINFSSRVCSVGWVITSGTTNGKILVSITNENKVQSLTNKQVNILLGNTISTGVFEFTGLTKTSNTTFQIAPVKAWFVDNTSNPVIPQVLQVNYSGSTTGQTTPYLTTTDSTFVLMTSAGTISYQTSFPSPQQRRQNIFLGKVVHPSRTSILNVNNTVDFDVSPMSALRDLWTPIKGVNQGIIVSPHSTTLEINTSAGTLWGNGIGWTTNQLNPNSVSIPGKSPATFAYRTQTGGTTGEVSLIDVGNYDVGGAVTSIPGTQYTTQRVYQFPTGLIRIQYGQNYYSTLAKALAALTTETFVEYVNNRDNGILIGLITVASNASNLSNTNQAIFTLVSKFGEVLTGTAGGFSTTTLQQAYDNSVQPEIITNSTLGAVTFRRGSVDETDNVFEVQNTSGVNTFAVTGLGNVSGNSFNVKTYIYDSLNTSGVTNQVLFTTPSGVRWNNIDSIVTGYTSSKLNITDFNSYSSNTLNTINNNYSQFTGFTNSFNSYSANTLTSINNKVIELGSGIGSTIRINNCNSTTGIYSSILGGLSGTTTGNYSSILGGLRNNITGVNSSILGGSGNTITSDNSTIGGGRNNTTTCNNSFILGSNITANAIDTTFTQCINACGQTLLQGTSASSGCALLVRNSTPLALYTALNTGQHLFNGTFTATANATCGWNLNQTLRQRNTVSDTLYATYINPTIIYTQNNQTNKALSVQALFTGSSITLTGATNIIADFSATNVGTQLSITDVTTGVIYGVNDVSGLPIIDATSNWDVNIYDFPNTVLSKTGKTLTFGVIRNTASTVTVQSDLIFNEGLGLGYRMSQVTGLTTGSSVSVLYQLTIPTGQTVFLTTNTLGRANNANMDSTLGEIKFTAKRSLTGNLTQVGVVQGFVNRDNNNTNVGIDISSNNIRLVVTGDTDTYLWSSTIITQTY